MTLNIRYRMGGINMMLRGLDRDILPAAFLVASFCDFERNADSHTWTRTRLDLGSVEIDNGAPEEKSPASVHPIVESFHPCFVILPFLLRAVLKVTSVT